MVNPIDISASLNIVNSAERIMSENVRIQPEAQHQMQRTISDRTDETRTNTANPVGENEQLDLRADAEGGGLGGGGGRQEGDQSKQPRDKASKRSRGDSSLPGHIDVVG